MPTVLSAAARPPCASAKTVYQLLEGEGMEEWMLDLFAHVKVFSQPVATGSFSASCQEESENKKLQKQWGSCILQLKTELCRVLSSSASIRGRSSSPFLCILNTVGAYFNAFNQLFGGVFFSLLSMQIEAGTCLVKAMLFPMQPRYVSVTIQKSWQSDCRWRWPFMVLCQKSSLILMASAVWTESK